MTTALVVRQPPWWVQLLWRQPVERLFSLWGIENPLAFVRGAISDELNATGGYLDPDAWERLSSHLHEVLCALTKRYDPSIGLSFSTYAYPRLRWRHRDWLRKELGDSRYGNNGRLILHADPRLLIASGATPAFTDSRGPSDRIVYDALMDALQHAKLSARARGTLTRIARVMAEEDITATEAAERLGKTRREAAADLKRLREELAAA